MLRGGRFLVLTTLAVTAAACGAAGSEQQGGEEPAGQTDDASAADVTAEASQIDWAEVEAAFGRSGSTQSGDVFKFGMPRSDLTVTSNGVTIAPALALGSWLAFKPRGPNEAVAMGDLVLTEEEYNRVIARLQEGGVGQTAVHKHLPETSPAIWWTHIHAEGDPVQIAGVVRSALELTGTPPEAQPGDEPVDATFDSEQISQILGYSGNVSGGVLQVSVPRAETIQVHGIEVPASMGTGTAINFQPTGAGTAAIAGDFVMTADEVQGVIRTLEENGIAVVSLHNHMLTEEPRLFFAHFWADDEATRLAQALRAALDQINVQPGDS